MFTIQNNTRFTFSVERGEGVQGPDTISPNTSNLYTAAGAVPTQTIKASSSDAPSGFTVVYVGTFGFSRDKGPLEINIKWGGEITLFEIAVPDWTATQG